MRFTLPTEQEEYSDAVNGARYKDALRELARSFREERKYAGPPVTEEVFYDILTNCDVSVE